MITLSPKALARWAWLPGMAALDRHGKRWRICAGEGGHLYAAGESSGYIGGWLATAPLVGATPDFSDPVTAACLPLVVGMMWGDESPYCKGLYESWTVYVWTKNDVKHAFNGTTRLGAWMKALEAAP